MLDVVNEQVKELNFKVNLYLYFCFNNIVLQYIAVDHDFSKPKHIILSSSNEELQDNHINSKNSITFLLFIFLIVFFSFFSII